MLQSYIFDMLDEVMYYNDMIALVFICFLILTFILVTITVYFVTFKDPVITARALAFGKEKLGKCTYWMLTLPQFFRCALFILLISGPLLHHAFLYKIDETSKCLVLNIESTGFEVLTFVPFSLYVVLWFWVYFVIGIVMKCKQVMASREKEAAAGETRDQVLVKMLQAYRKGGYMQPKKGLVREINDQFWQFKEEDPKNKQEQVHIVDKKQDIKVTLDIRQLNFNLKEHKQCDEAFYVDKFNKIRILFKRKTDVVVD